MAISATFTANFASFYAAVNQANAKLQQLTDAATKTGDSLNKMGKTAETGLTMIKGFLALEITQRVISFGQEIAAAASELNRLSAQTGISIEWLQKFQRAGDEAGVSIDAVAAAVFQLTNRIGSGDKSAIAALETLGLRFDAIRAMSPEERFNVVSAALRTMQSETDRTAAGTDLMGRTFMQVLPLIKRGIDDVKDATVGMNRTTVKEWAEMSDTITRWWRDSKATLANAVVYFGVTLPDALGVYVDALQLAFGRETFRVTDNLKDLNKELAEMDERTRKVGAGLGLPTGLPDIKGPRPDEVRALDNEIEKSIEVNKQAAKAAEDHAKALQDFRESLMATEGVAVMMSGQIRAALTDISTLPSDAMGEVLEEGIARATIAFRDAEREAEQARELGRSLAAESRAQLDADVAAASRSLEAWLATMATVGETVGPQIDQALLEARKHMKSFANFLKDDLPKTILAAITGGGDAIKAAGALIGNYLLDPKQSGLGAAIAKGVSALPGFIGGALNTVLPGVGSLIGAGVSKIGGWIKGLFTGGEGAKVNDLRDQFVSAAGGILQLNKAAFDAGLTLDNLLAAKKVDTFNAAVKELNDAFAFQKTAMDAVVETAQRYGFTLEELGPALQRQQLDQQAQQLYKDYEVLTSAGIDLVAVHERMSESVNAYVNHAIAMGVEVPSAMKPMLQSFVDAGTLLDANGNAITNLEDSGISFAMTMSEGFKALIDTVKQLTDAIARGLGLAIKNVPPVNVQGHVTWNVPPVPTPGATVPIEGYQDGTDGYRDFGAGTPVMLHGWEAVVPREQASTLGPSAAAALTSAPAGGSGPSVVINAQGAFFDTPGDLQRLADRVNEALTQKYGLRYQVRAA